MFIPILRRPILPRFRNRRKGSERGQSLVEFAILLPVLMIILLGVVEFGWALKAYVQEQNAAREGARYWALHSTATCSLVKGAVDATAPGTLDWTDIDALPATGVTDCTAATATSITVTAVYEYPFITPLGTFVTSIAGPLKMKSSATMRVE
jgi:Flp pilus assembly protein TadG